jgi:hypothetical protein
VAAAGVNPLCHYLKHGAAQLRQPHPLFDPSFYLDRNPDVRRAGVNPLVHYVRHGAAEDRKPHPLFEPTHYRNSCAEAPTGELLAHFLESGAGAASPHPLFDCEAYLGAHPDAAAQGTNPLVHYLLSDAAARPAGRMPESAAIAQIDIQDVQVTVVLLASQTPEERRIIHETWKRWAVPASVALVWTDAAGLTRWLAEPQQQPFFDAKRGQTHFLPNR